MVSMAAEDVLLPLMEHTFYELKNHMMSYCLIRKFLNDQLLC